MSSGEQDPNERPVLRGRHILVAEDEPAIRAVLRRVLEMQGCVVHEAEEGQTAAEIARQVPVDLVMTDLWMPVMNGVELIEALNAMDCPAEVIVLSAHITCETTEKLRRLGVFRILRKPVDIATLVETAQTGLRSDRRRRLAEEFADGLGSGAGDGPSLVLIADDDDEVRGLLRGLIAGAGYRVEEARNGEEAVEKVLAHDVSLVLMDLNMPRHHDRLRPTAGSADSFSSCKNRPGVQGRRTAHKASGQQAVEVLRRAWGHDGMTRTRISPPRTGAGSLKRASVVSPGFIVCMTGECTKREMDEGLRAGAASCFRKPFDVAALLAEVARLDAISLHRRRLAAPLTTAHSNGALFGHACLSFSTSLPGRTAGGRPRNKRALTARLTLLGRIREFIRSVGAAHFNGALFRHACAACRAGPLEAGLVTSGR
jgi:CheY-like chemotaxis protein